MSRITCPYCKSHRSKRTRTCICCKAKALPSCRPERCMIVAGLTTIQGLNVEHPHRHIATRFVRRTEGSWTLCRQCMQEQLIAMFAAQAERGRGPTSQCFPRIAGIISLYCGGPWTANLAWFYQQLHGFSTWDSPEGEPPQEEDSWPVEGY